MIQSEADAFVIAQGYGPITGRERRYRGGPPSKKLIAAAVRHETRARRHGVPYDMVDLRDVYAEAGGVCGVCDQHVSEAEFIIDHIVPMSAGGPHLKGNLQPAHFECNVRKGRTIGPFKIHAPSHANNA